MRGRIEFVFSCLLSAMLKSRRLAFDTVEVVDFRSDIHVLEDMRMSRVQELGDIEIWRHHKIFGKLGL